MLHDLVQGPQNQCFFNLGHNLYEFPNHQQLSLITSSFWIAVLILALVELIFFTVPSRGQGFGFLLETVLIQECFPYYLNRAKAFSAPHPTPPASGLGLHKK